MSLLSSESESVPRVALQGTVIPCRKVLIKRSVILLPGGAVHSDDCALTFWASATLLLSLQISLVLISFRCYSKLQTSESYCVVLRVRGSVML